MNKLLLYPRPHEEACAAKRTYTVERKICRFQQANQRKTSGSNQDGMASFVSAFCASTVLQRHSKYNISLIPNPF